MSTETESHQAGSAKQQNLQRDCWLCNGEGPWVTCQECGNRVCQECLDTRGTEPSTSPPQCKTCWGVETESPQIGELPECDCATTPGSPDGPEEHHECGNCQALRELGTTREEWARLQADKARCSRIDAGTTESWRNALAELDEEHVVTDDASAYAFGQLCEVAGLINDDNTELRAKLTEAEGKVAELKRWAESDEEESGALGGTLVVSLVERDAERARAVKAEAKLSKAVHRQRDAEDSAANANTEADEFEEKAASLQKRVAELEGEQAGMLELCRSKNHLYEIIEILEAK